MIKQKAPFFFSHVLWLTVLIASCRTSLGRDEAVDLPREVTISHLGEKGDRMRVFSEPKVSFTRKELIRTSRVDRSSLKDSTPAFEITTTGKNGGGTVMSILRPFGVEPLTRYRLSWDQKVEAIGAAAPIFFIECQDINFDKIGEITVPIKSAVPPNRWGPESVEFTTSPLTRNLRLALRTAKGGPAHFWLDQVWFEQISTPAAFAPDSVPVVSGLAPGPQAEVFLIPAERRALTLSATVQWSAWAGKCEVQFEWLDQNANPVGTHTCRIAPMKGVLPQWNGITADWIGDLRRPTDPISEARTEHLDAATGPRTTTVRYTVAVPAAVSSVRVRLVNDTSAGLLVVNEVAIGVEPTVAAGTTHSIKP
jgi:hypothetical protein